MKKSKAVVFDQYGPPAEVVRVEEQETPSLGPEDVLVRMQAAPINPADLNLMEGKYGVHPNLPAIVGTEGTGVVAELGDAVRGIELGQQVILPHGLGTWREMLVVDAARLISVPSGIPVQQAAMLRVNPATAWRMLHDFVELHAGDWIAQNAANSGVGRAVIQIAKSRGIRTVNVVRRPELIAELQLAGGDVVLLDDEKLADEISDATNRAPIALALNAVGGEGALRLANALAPGGTIVTYGAMSKQPVRIPNGLLIFKDLRWRGFWVTRWYERASSQDVKTMFAQLCSLAQRGVLTTPIEREYGIDDAREAIQHAQQNKRAGKILLRLGE